MSFMSSTHQSQFDLGQSSTETVLLAKEQWEVIKLRRTWDLELKKFRERQSHRVRSVNAKANEKAKRLHEKVFFTMRWAHPKLSSAYQQLILEYCDHLTGPNPESNFEKFPFLTAWREKMVGTEAEKVFRTVTQLVTALADVVTHRNTSIRKTNEHTALQTERLAVQKEGSVSWKVHQTQSARDNYWTIWYLAKHNKQSELLRFLESPDCLPIDTFDPDHGFTALHYACMRGHFDIALLLLEAGANERAPSLCDGRTPLHMAAAYGSRELVLELLACGADENARDRFNCTPLQLARQNRNTAVAKTLENWNYLVPADIGSNDEENDLKEVIPEELVATDESIVSQMSRPLQVITRRLEAAVDVAATIRARIHVDTCLQVAQAQGVDSAPSQTAEDECFERETNSESAGNIAGTAVLLEIRLCEKHAYMSMEEGFPMEAIKSLRRRWRAAREYVNAIDSVNRHIDVQFGLNVNKEEFVSISDVLYPEVSFQYAVEIAMEAAELCLAYGKHEWAELIISEALLLRDFR